jgi:hypothetical protein
MAHSRSVWALPSSLPGGAARPVSSPTLYTSGGRDDDAEAAATRRTPKEEAARRMAKRRRLMLTRADRARTMPRSRRGRLGF